MGSVLPQRRLGAHGPLITVVGFGTWAIGGPYLFGWGEVDDDDSIAAIRYAVEQGVNWVDTAPIYGLGHSEEVTGKALGPYTKGEEVFVFTKCGRPWLEEAGEIGFDLRPASIRAECEKSLVRLGLERIDLYQIHWPDPVTGTEIEDSWETLTELREEGKVRWLGVSNFDIELMKRCQAIHHIDSMQPPLSLINRKARSNLIPWASENETGVIAYAPMANGLLTGKYDLAAIKQLGEDDWRKRSAHFNEPELSRNLELVRLLRATAESIETTLPSLAVAWALSLPGVTGAAIGARNAMQVDGWIKAATLNLDERVLKQIEEAITSSGAGEEL